MRILFYALLSAAVAFALIKEVHVYQLHLTKSRENVADNVDLYRKHDCKVCLAKERDGKEVCPRHLECYHLERWNGRNPYFDALINTILVHNPCSGTDMCYYGTLFVSVGLLFGILYATWLWLWWFVSPRTSPLASALQGERCRVRIKPSPPIVGHARQRDAFHTTETVPGLFEDGYT